MNACKSVKLLLMALQHIVPQLQQTLSLYNPPATLIAVTKHATQDQMMAAYEAGVRHFGENKVQDALLKKSALPAEISRQVQWHLIGHLQKNKVIKTVGQFDWIHSVDSFALAEKIGQLNQQANSVQKVLLQVNVAEEPQKFGFSVHTLKTEFQHCLALSGISVEGLMMIAPAEYETHALQTLFSSLKDLRNTLEDTCQKPLPQLSMGMSQDFRIALDCGATMIRLGNLLFS
jgi:PLP dependent protein